MANMARSVPAGRLATPRDCGNAVAFLSSDNASYITGTVLVLDGGGLMLWAVEELSYKEIAAAVGIPIGTVMSRLHRARQRLSEQLRHYAKREGIIRE